MSCACRERTLAGKCCFICAVRKAALSPALGVCQALQAHAALQETRPCGRRMARTAMGFGAMSEAGSAAQRAHGELQALHIRLNQHALVLLRAGSDQACCLSSSKVRKILEDY